MSQWSAPLSLSGSCQRQPGGKHAAPCHPWHARSVEEITVGLVRLMHGLPAAIPSPSPYPSRHAASETLPVELAAV